MSIAIPADVRERVIQAAQELYEQNGRESMPTVDAVRRLDDSGNRAEHSKMEGSVHDIHEQVKQFYSRLHV